MNFYIPDLLFDKIKRNGFSGTIEQARQNMISGNMRLRSSEIAMSIDQLAIEVLWAEQGRPYYKVWPSIINSLLKIKLDIPPNLIQIPCGCLALRLPINDSRFEKLQCMIAAIRPHINSFQSLSISYGACAKYEGDLNQGANVHIPLNCATIEDGFNAEWPETGLRDFDPVSCVDFDLTDLMAAKFVVGVCLLAHDPSIVQPDVLAADRARFDQSTDPAERQRLIDKARKRGIVGWRIGESYETCPHYRRPHFALRWTEKGYAVPRIVPVKGAIVHRQKLTEVPTGYITPDGKEVEP